MANSGDDNGGKASDKSVDKPFCSLDEKYPEPTDRLSDLGWPSAKQVQRNLSVFRLDRQYPESGERPNN